MHGQNAVEDRPADILIIGTCIGIQIQLVPKQKKLHRNNPDIAMPIPRYANLLMCSEGHSLNARLSLTLCAHRQFTTLSIA